ncbi:hypothetical protein [Arthrobacter cavernae]|uniref:Calcineurin-like phosphoesterase domain-containing protein n=1 Tax=Arthrobacter cavernae TaxID=2817681 RepID=A0A939HC63_9MICC|nr:hypothetical protein [Arthrobacter cavernae]MBO1266464.1 hypothetical protein [Arthrobacter cavernae]
MKRRELAEHRAVLGFTPREAVRWLSPMSLARTALKVMAATVFADFGDKRELEGGFPSDPLDLDRLPVPGQPAQPPVGSRPLPSPGEPAAEEAATSNTGKELWLDFAADLGDGFDATYSVALLLAQETLDVGGAVLPRGRVLVLGGDEVYPVASPVAYEDRMTGPYRMAFPASRNPIPGNAAGGPAGPPAAVAAPAAVMLALPGNHDWYDGLTSFIRMFTRQRSIGAWRTIQTRSYFAVRLSGEGPREGHQGTPGWWLLGLDSQLGQYIDEPQLDDFYRNVTTRLQPSDAIILCVAAPYWVYADQPGSSEFRQVNFFEQDYLRRRFNPDTGLFEATGATVRLWLSGDLHHYSRYEQRGPGEAQELPPDPARAQLITCGLGGAYLSDAHWLPQDVVLPPMAGSPGESAAQPPSSAVPEASGPETTAPGASGRRFTRMPGIYPQPADSRRYGRRLANPLSPYWLPVRNPGFGVLLGIVHLVAFLTLWTVFSAFRGLSFVDSLRGLTRGNTLLLAVLLLAVLLVAVPLVLLGLLALLAKWLGLARRGLVVFLRGALYQLSALAVSAAVVILIPWPNPWPHFLIAALALALVYVGGWAVGSEAFAFFIQGTPGGEVASWRMSGQAIEDHKGFLRLHLAPDGSVTVYPLAVDSICRDWKLEDNDDGACLVPVSGLPAVRLLEQPVTIARKGA